MRDSGRQSEMSISGEFSMTQHSHGDSSHDSNVLRKRVLMLAKGGGHAHQVHVFFEFGSPA